MTTQKLFIFLLVLTWSDIVGHASSNSSVYLPVVQNGYTSTTVVDKVVSLLREKEREYR